MGMTPEEIALEYPHLSLAQVHAALAYYHRVRKLSKTYVRRRWLAPPLPATAALARVSFSLDRGRSLAIIGASGSGKSTLARCLTQFETPSGGEILFEGRPLAPERRVSAWANRCPVGATS
jgi:ABC-type oligopeptide transport system ATPase subunit